MESPQKPDKPATKNSNNLLLVILIGQVGFLTLIVILAAVFGGMALDRQLGTRPWFTIGLLVASVPVSILLMVFVSRRTVKKIQNAAADTTQKKEDEIGKIP
ncbi:MAG TPA: hypothetical protein DDW19_00250 [Anaerolineaceae bacterium]|jgi:F0F1-type ATP synthase assembly protein I|nr:hypothetical protein [Anaerolineaceae bacterium]